MTKKKKVETAMNVLYEGNIKTGSKNKTTSH